MNWIILEHCMSTENQECLRKAWEIFCFGMKEYTSQDCSICWISLLWDALDPALMVNCSTRSEFAALDATKSDNQNLIDLYKVNKKLCTIIVLGQDNSHQMAHLSKTRSDDIPSWLAWKFVVKAKKANKPCDSSPVIEMDVDLDQLQLKGARDFYNDVFRVMDKYKVSKTNRELYMLMAHKNQDAWYELKSNSLDFDRLCNDVSEIQRLTQSRNKGGKHKEVHLSSDVGNSTFQGKCRNCSKVCRYKANKCKKFKENSHSGLTSKSKGDNTRNGSSNNMRNFCGVNGHKESQCCKKNPKKTPEWWKKKNAKWDRDQHHQALRSCWCHSVIPGRR